MQMNISVFFLDKCVLKGFFQIFVAAGLFSLMKWRKKRPVNLKMDRKIFLGNLFGFNSVNENYYLSCNAFSMDKSL
ncbi:hypothetical protein DN752_23895 [Echinicola strongylocentroti]|uniref:Uncharacterized protein n=1 Tax=Echinicola strongylocentroti TaxID=1795355 RepID=A0A2Z4IRJ8_9BACT|nr:hypothetical protein DN752_23895 [Echinicola strongylocentroti]